MSRIKEFAYKVQRLHKKVKYLHKKVKYLHKKVKYLHKKVKNSSQKSSIDTNSKQTGEGGVSGIRHGYTLSGLSGESNHGP